jgi:hypothetical protein
MMLCRETSDIEQYMFFYSSDPGAKKAMEEHSQIPVEMLNYLKQPTRVIRYSEKDDETLTTTTISSKVI